MTVGPLVRFVDVPASVPPIDIGPTDPPRGYVRFTERELQIAPDPMLWHQKHAPLTGMTAEQKRARHRAQTKITQPLRRRDRPRVRAKS